MIALLLGIGFWLYVHAAGYALLRLARLPGGVLRLALAAPVGMALLSALTTWTTYVGLPALATTIVAALPAAAGLALILRRPASLGQSEHPAGLSLMGSALALTAVMMSFGFAGVDAPLSTQDGANHVELIDVVRHGTASGGWYPTGLHSSIAAFLGLAPWVDTAEGAVGASIGLTFLAVITVFGVSYAVWRNAVIAGSGALLLALTFQFPYHVHFWAGWPLAAAIIVALGVWVVAVEYVRRPCARSAAVAGLLVGSILLIHGTEVYTVAIGLLALLAGGGWRRLRGVRSGLQVSLALIVALVIAAPYLQTLLPWAGSGGASGVGAVQAQAEAALSGDTATEGMLILMFNTFGTGVGVDLPLRICLVVLGTWQAMRWGAGRVVVAIGGIFLGLAFTFAVVHGPLVERVYSSTFPWSQAYRLLMIAAVSAALLQGLGGVVVVRAYLGARHRWTVVRASRSRRVHALVTVLLSLLAVGSAGSLAILLSENTSVYASTTADDAAAMAWLRMHARPGEVVANDWFADAGIWAPYKAGTPIVMPRLVSDRLDERQLILDNIGHLDASPQSLAAACALDVGYVYDGAKATGWEPRHWPPLSELQRSPSLEEVFTSGRAVVFKTRLPCDS
jgi:hypothetical protein